MKLEPVPEKELKKHPEQSGCQVRAVEMESPGERAGVKENDIVHAVNGKLCIDPNVFSQAVGEAAGVMLDGGSVHLNVLRKGKPMAFDLRYPLIRADTAAIRQSAGNLAKKNAPAAAPSSGVHLGISVRAVTDADVAPMKLARARGIVVVDVDKGSLAEKMGLQEGDVILEVNNSEIGDVDLFSQFVHSGAAKKLKLWRKGQALEVAFPQSM